MNLHPIIVHFPIAFLFVWSLCEIFPVGKWFRRIDWKSVKTFLILVGFVGGWVASMTGEQAEHMLPRDFAVRNLVHMHSFFAQLTMILFGLFAFEVVIRFIKAKYANTYNKFGILAKIVDWCLNLLEFRLFRMLLALMAMIAIFVTGLLGGVLVYGPTADPIAPLVLKILGL